MGCPRSKSVTETKRSGPLSYLRPHGPMGGIRTRVSLLAGEVSVACAPGTPDAVPPEIKDGLRRDFSKEVAAGLRTGRCMKLWPQHNRGGWHGS